MFETRDETVENQKRAGMARRQRFGEYTLESNPLSLYKGQCLVRVTARQLQTLWVLADAKGEVVSQEMLLSRVWNDVTVEKHNVTQTIFRLRRILGRMTNGSQYIETVPGHGYRISSVALLPARPLKVPNSPNPSERNWWKKVLQRFPRPW